MSAATAKVAPATASNASPNRQMLSARPVPELTWDELATRAQQMVATMQSYLDQLAVSSRPSTVAAAALALRHLAAHLTETDLTCKVGGGDRASPRRVLQSGAGSAPGQGRR